MASSTWSPTVRGATGSWPRISRGAAAGPGGVRWDGRLRAASAMRVGTYDGHRTVTPTPGARWASSARNVSDSATTPCLLTVYGPERGQLPSPMIDAVLTT